MLTKKPEMLQSDAICEHSAVKCDCGMGSATDPVGEAYSAPHALPLVLRGPYRGGEEREEKGRNVRVANSPEVFRDSPEFGCYVPCPLWLSSRQVNVPNFYGAKNNVNKDPYFLSFAFDLCQ